MFNFLGEELMESYVKVLDEISSSFVLTLIERIDALVEERMPALRNFSLWSGENMIGQGRYELTRTAFNEVAKEFGFEVKDGRIAHGGHTRPYIEFEDAILTSHSEQFGKGFPRESKTLSSLAKQPNGNVSQVVDLFSRRTLIEINKPLYCWAVVWEPPRKKDNLPKWCGFARIESERDSKISKYCPAIGSEDALAFLLSKEMDVEKQSATARKPKQAGAKEKFTVKKENPKNIDTKE